MEKLKQALGIVMMVITIIITIAAAICGYKEYKADKARARYREHKQRRMECEQRRKEREAAKKAATL